jgi:hypothetical protein
MRFLDVMRGTRTAAPTRLLPVTKMPHAAPRIDVPTHSATPTTA